MDRRNILVEELDFPLISFCFGFDLKFNKNAAFVSYESTANYFNTYPDASEPITSEQLNQWWENVTINPADVLESITFNYYNPLTDDAEMQRSNTTASHTVVSGNNDFKTEDFEIKEFGTDQGKCIVTWLLSNRAGLQILCTPYQFLVFFYIFESLFTFLKVWLHF